MDLGEWKIPSSASGLGETLFSVERLSDARTPLAGFFSILLDDSAFADIVGDIAGGIGEANDRFCADIGNHAGKSFPALLVE